MENSWWEHKPKGGAGSCKGSQIPQLAGYLAKERGYDFDGFLRILLKYTVLSFSSGKAVPSGIRIIGRSSVFPGHPDHLALHIQFIDPNRTECLEINPNKYGQLSWF